MKEVLYAAEKDFLERYLKEKASATMDDLKAIADLWGDPIYEAGSVEAVNRIYSTDGDTARIRIEGPLSPEGPDLWDMFWGYAGTAYSTIRAAMERARTDQSIARVILDIDSPGGTVDGVDETWQTHKALNAVKPTEVHAGGLLASAAYYLASPAGEILANAPTSEIGSIGVIMAAYDYSKWEENNGIREIIITSSNAPDKAPDITTSEGRDTLKARLDALERIFYARVAEGRNVTPEHIAGHFGRGGLLVAWDPDDEKGDALSVGMIDGLLSETESRGITDALEEAMKPGAKYFDAAGKELPSGECERIRQGLLAMADQSENTSPSGESDSPATAGTGGNAMTLQEFMAQNPAAKAEVDSLAAKAREEAKAELSAKVDRVMPIITSESYPSNIKAIAGNVLAGKDEMAAFTAAVAVFDANREATASGAARGETAANGAAAPAAPDNRSAEQRAVDDAWAASIAESKARAALAEKEAK